MRALAVLAALLASTVALASPAAAVCYVVDPGVIADIHYVTVCALDEQYIGEPGFGYGWNYVAHVSEVVQAEGTFQYVFVNVGQGYFEYLDEESGSSYSGQGTDISFVTSQGYRPVYGTGAHASFVQEETVANACSEPGQCTRYATQRSDIGAGGWFTVREVTSVGVGVYWHQVDDGSGCQEYGEVDVDTGGILTVIPVTPSSCVHALPMIHEDYPLPHWPELPPL